MSGGNVFLLPTTDGVTYFGAGNNVWWATKTRLVGNKNTFGGQQKHVWWATKHVWWATKRRCPPYELLPIKIGNSGYFYRQFETSPIWRGGYSQNENPERCNVQDDVKTANWDLDSL